MKTIDIEVSAYDIKAHAALIQEHEVIELNLKSLSGSPSYDGRDFSSTTWETINEGFTISVCRALLDGMLAASVVAGGVVISDGGCCLTPGNR